MTVGARILRLAALSLLVSNLNAIAQSRVSNSHPPKSAKFEGTACSFGHEQTAVNQLIARARNGDAGAQFWTGVAFEQGWCAKADLGKAFDWYKLSAAQGDADAQNALGQMYEEGRPVKQDYTLAAEWYRKAAEHVPDLGGAGQGRSNLGALYMQGLGVPKDLVQAYMWFLLAHSKINLAQVRAGMTPAQICQAEQLAEDWTQSHPAS